MMKRFLYHIVFFLILIPTVVYISGFAFFLKMTDSDPALEKADLIVVFTGEHGRVEQAFRLAGEGYGSRLVVSSAPSGRVRYYLAKRGGGSNFKTIIEDESRTTFENALYTRKIITRHGIRSVILVTSWDHMPRSYFLLKILSLGSGLQIQRCRVPTGPVNEVNWHRSALGWKRAHNEMIELWGSLYEFAQYSIRGSLPEEPPNRCPIMALLRNAFLFDDEGVDS
jgi:uncharacterized SAM-binding protein YcdF (DUF218 family)